MKIFVFWNVTSCYWYILITLSEDYVTSTYTEDGKSGSSETLIPIFQAIRCYIPEDNNPYVTCDISGPHGGKYKYFCLPGCDTV
jgi:hypothetical protein